MIEHEYRFTRNIAIEDFFALMMENRGSHTGWKFEHDPALYTIVWTPTILLNVWQMHPKVTATLEEVSKGATQCKVVTINKGFIDPFNIFKHVHEKSYKRLFDPIRKASKQVETTTVTTVTTVTTKTNDN
jgi:hypothetical protein